jgi:hypothetical protein
MKESVEDFLVEHRTSIVAADSASQMLLFSYSPSMLKLDAQRDVSALPTQDVEQLHKFSSDATKFFTEATAVANGDKLFQPPVFELTKDNLKLTIESVYNLLDSKKENGKQVRGELQAAYKELGFKGKIPEMTIEEVLENSKALYPKDMPQVRTVDEGTVKPAAMTASKHI